MWKIFKQAHLQDKKHITRLQFLFNESEETDQKREKQDEELVHALNVPPNLEILNICNYLGIKTPNWFDSLTVMRLVDLYAWENYEYLPK